MTISLSYILIAFVVVLITYLYRRSANIRKKLWWVQAVPGFPIIGNGLDFLDANMSLQTMHDFCLKYNGLCLIELLFRPMILISDYKLLEWLLSSQTILTKSKEYSFFHRWLGDGLITANGEKWRKSRKILTPAFHFTILEQFVDAFYEPTSLLIDRFNKEVGKDSVDICSYVQRATMDLICRTAMGMKLDELSEKDGFHNDYHHAVTELLKIFVERSFNPLKNFDFFYKLTQQYRQEKKLAKYIHDVSDKVIEMRRREISSETEQELNDDEIGRKKETPFLDVLLKYRDENGQPLTTEFIRHQVNTFTAAGYDTIASAISFGMYCLADHPEVQAEVLLEVKEVLGDRTKPTFRDLQNLKYMGLVIKEILRLYPSGPFYARATTSDVVYEGEKIVPKGVTLGIVAYAINRNPKVFEEPDKFIPTRFLKDVKPFSYLPFSAGPRNCIGQKFAMLELKTFFAKILLTFKLLPAIPEHKPIVVNPAVIMPISLSYILVAVLVVLITYLYRRSANIKKKLWWVQAAPAYPLIGNAYDFVDSTKSLNAMHEYCLRHNGLCYIELLLRPLILISDYKFVEWQLSSQTLLTKAQEYGFLFNWLEGGLLISDGAAWKKSRKIVTPAFHFGTLEQYVDIFDAPISVLIELLGKEVDKNAVDIYPYITRYTLDVICQTAMGVDLNIQKDYQSDYVNAVAGMCKIIMERAFNPLKMFEFTYNLSADSRNEKKYVKLLHEVSDRVIETRKREIAQQTQAEEAEDIAVGVRRKFAFLDLLLKYRDENGEPLSQSFIRHEVDTFMFAGHDTTASAISFAMYCLANHPDVQAKALSEVKDVLGERTKPTSRDLQKLKYLELIIKETLRLYPSVPMYSRLTTEETEYEDDKVIPKGVTLIILAYTINRDPKVFEEPDKFIPTRFLNMDLKPFSYLPFSAGPRNCIGQKFAILEMKSSLAKILLNYELLPAVPEHKVILANEAVLKSSNGVKIKLKKRV